MITGPFNFTKAAEERNTENLLIIQDSELAAKYAANWKLHRQHSEAYTGPFKAGEGAAPKNPRRKNADTVRPSQSCVATQYQFGEMHLELQEGIQIFSRNSHHLGYEKNFS